MRDARRTHRARDPSASEKVRDGARPDPSTPHGARRSTPHIPISRDHSVGTDSAPYHFSESVVQRTAALRAGLAAREEIMDPRSAAQNLRMRLNALRVVKRRASDCLVAENDYVWVTQLIAGARASPACLYYTHAANEPTALRVRLGRLLWGWFAGPWSLRIPASGTDAAEVVMASELLEQSVAAAGTPPDDVVKGGSADEFSYFLNHLVVDEPKLARRVAATSSPNVALETLAADWPCVVERVDDVWRLRVRHDCPPSSAPGCV